jgi:hypothetical protein
MSLTLVRYGLADVLPQVITLFAPVFAVVASARGGGWAAPHSQTK